MMLIDGMPCASAYTWWSVVLAGLNTFQAIAIAWLVNRRRQADQLDSERWSSNSKEHRLQLNAVNGPRRRNTEEP